MRTPTFIAAACGRCCRTPRRPRRGPGFTARGQLNLVSEVVTPGDIQMTGDGQPYVLMPECQTTGGYLVYAAVTHEYVFDYHPGDVVFTRLIKPEPRLPSPLKNFTTSLGCFFRTLLNLSWSKFRVLGQDFEK